MKTEKEYTQVFLVLVPHRDIRIVLRNYSSTLFKAGFPGAFHFPWAAPLASLSSPLDPQELKKTAAAIRKSADKGIITAAQTGTIPFPAEESAAMLFGPGLELGNYRQDLPIVKVKSFFSPVIGCCLLNSNKETPALLCPPLSFRAAAAANFFRQPVYSMHNGVIGYKWKIGKLFWLPHIKKD